MIRYNFSCTSHLYDADQLVYYVYQIESMMRASRRHTD